jgi:hypothetical protein
MVTIQAQYQSRFREITRLEKESFAIAEPTMAALAAAITGKYGPAMTALLMDEESKSLNSRGTLYLNSKGQRMYIEDSLTDGETVFFMVGIAGG